MILKIAPDAGMTMLSGVAADSDAGKLSKSFSTGELVRMMELIEKTVQGFTRSSSRRLDAELCIIRLCQPELLPDAESLNARLTRLEEQLKSGSFVAAAPVKAVAPEILGEDERPPLPGDEDAPPEDVFAPEQTQPEEAPAGFWVDLVNAVRQELRPPVSGFFVATPNAPVQGTVRGDRVVLSCANSFTQEMINKPEILAIVSRKAAVILNRPVTVVAVDGSAKPVSNERMQRLMSFGREHSDIVKIKE